MNCSFDEIRGKTLIDIRGATVGSEGVEFLTSDGSTYRLYHSQDCCESVALNEIIGDVHDLIGTPLLEAEESANQDDRPNGAESWTWTFYKLGTIKGHVTFRWLGESNGYYSEGVDFCRLSP